MNLFEDGFKEPKENFPEKLLQEITSHFPAATNDLVQLDIIEISKREKVNLLGGLNNNFQFKAVLASSYLRGYSFKVFEFGYDVSIYPAFIEVEEEMGGEMWSKYWNDDDSTEFLFDIQQDRDENTYIIQSDNEDSFEAALEAIFKTDKFMTTVGGLMKIARSKMEDSTSQKKAS